MSSRMTIRSLAFCWILIAGSLFLSQPLHAQNLSGSITGVVHDATGAIVPGVQIVLINQDQGIEARRTITNEAGIYLFSALPGATYTLTADLPGFKKIHTKGRQVVCERQAWPSAYRPRSRNNGRDRNRRSGIRTAPDSVGRARRYRH